MAHSILPHSLGALVPASALLQHSLRATASSWLAPTIIALRYLHLQCANGPFPAPCLGPNNFSVTMPARAKPDENSEPANDRPLSMDVARMCASPLRSSSVADQTLAFHLAVPFAARSIHTSPKPEQTFAPAVTSINQDAEHVQSILAHTLGRLKGFSRKLILRTVNRRIIAQVARRLTIGIPIVGFYFVSRLLVRDFARVQKERGQGHVTVSNLFALAFLCDCVDLCALGIGILGMSHRHFDFGADLGAAAAGLMVLADRYSLAMAACSFTAGVSGELLTVIREEKEKLMMMQQQHTDVASASSSSSAAAAAAAAAEGEKQACTSCEKQA